MRIPFSVYDFFGYLFPGSLLLIAISYSMGGTSLASSVPWVNDPVLRLYVLGMMSYIVGHIVAQCSGGICDRVMIDKVLKRPNQNLFRQSSDRDWRDQLFSKYVRPFDDATKSRILSLAHAQNMNQQNGESLFLHAWAKVKKDKDTMERLTVFLSLYGFCRNTSFVFGVLAVVCVIHPPVHATAWFISVALAFLTLFYRYLYFLRRYAEEVFLTYASFEDPNVSNGRHSKTLVGEVRRRYRIEGSPSTHHS